MVRPGNAAAVYVGMKHGRERAQGSRATGVLSEIGAISFKETAQSEDATSASKKPASKEAFQLEDSSSLFVSKKQAQQRKRESCSRTELCRCKACFAKRLEQITETCSSAASCGCGARFQEDARFCKECGAPHPSAARAEKRAKDPSRPRTPALQRSAAQAAQRQNSLSSSHSEAKVSQGCTGCSVM